ncbi:transposase [Planctomycetota bacterium]|nr:transposase [Planctomycetota bacterium]MDC1043714.1 transposase [bacterium]
MNRAIARRTLFEDRTDVRYFLSRLAREVRAGRLEMQAWSVMGTHFHLLVRSPRGELSQAMRRAQNEYVRHFNRRHRRDGTLMRGRFFSKPVTTERYRRVLVAYIDQNPVVAGIVRRTWLYPWGSATHFASERSVPWHERAWVHSVVEEVREEDEALGTTYRRRFGGSLQPGLTDWIEQRLSFRVSMCRLLASASWNEIGNQTGRPASSCASSFKRHHARLIDGHEPYRQAAARVGALVAQAVSGQEWTTGRCAR